jgi:exopolysaccharide biosynthesis polyprenyl glycosylphosphotransferase
VTQLSPRVGSPAASLTDLLRESELRRTTGRRLEPRLVPSGTPKAAWTRAITSRLVLSDAISAALAVALGFGVRIGFASPGAPTGYLLASMVVTVAWLISLQVTGSYEVRVITAGTLEYRRVLRAAVGLAGAVAIVGYLGNSLLGRTFVAIVIPTGAILMLLARFTLRRAIYRRRRHGDWCSTILAVGTSESVQHLVQTTQRVPETGLVVVGACVEDVAVGAAVAPGVPVVGDVANAADIAGTLDVDIVAVAGSGLGPRRVRELGWALEGTRRDMVMAPGLTEVAGPRVHVSPVEGLPLMWVDQPQFTGARRVIKRALDVIVSIGAIVVLAPVLVAIGLAVRLTSRGPAIYRSTRNGQGGRTFTVYKFRSMYRDADERRRELLQHNAHGDSVLFKMRQDPRVTPVGRVLRKLSLDELPQLFNILLGSMSLVGPRPPLPDEVERYEGHTHRRLLVKPGLTGLWQVSGRSDLSWEESVRLDLYYVENWSLGFDFAIIARTVWAVLQRRGAY